MYNFQKELRRALLKYALLPALLLAFISLLLIGYSWNHYVWDKNHGAREALTSRMADILQENTAIMEQAEKEIGISSAEFRRQMTEAEARADLYAALYERVNQSPVNLDFYLTDEAGKLLLGSNGTLPAGVQAGWGILHRLQQDKDIHSELLNRSDGGQDMLWGKAVYREGRLQGYLLFRASGEKLMQAEAPAYITLAITDRFYNKIAASGIVPVDGQGKILSLLWGKNDTLVEVQPEIYYVTQDNLPQGVRVLAITPVRSLLSRYFMGGMLLLVLLALLVPVIFWSVKRESRLRAQTVEKLTSKAEMRQLVSQFNPHFLFNTLENIKYMVKLNPGAAVKMLVSLSALLRYSINNSLQQVRLADDLAYVHRYLEIQQYRFGKRLAYTEDIAQEAMDCEIPKLLFQPVLENAIKYGMDKTGTRQIHLQVALENDCLQLAIRDKGPGFSQEALSSWAQMLAADDNATEHTGLFNIHRRIQLLYGRSYGIEILSRPGENCVRICLPKLMTKEKI